MITGSYPPDICGVGDYTACFLKVADRDKWSLYNSSVWKISTFFQKKSDISKFQFSHIVIQYPTLGYGWNLLPQLLCIYYSLFTDKKVVVVLHELSQRTLKAQLASLLFFISHKVILTSEYEKEYAHRYYKISLNRMGVVKIVSNIEACNVIKDWDCRSIDLCYFGLLRPEKGLEDFFVAALYLRKNRENARICLIGQILPEHKLYIDKLLNTYADARVEQIYNRENKEVASLLNESKVTFLPFPDGLSERRGSFLAAISNGTLVVSYEGSCTPQLLKTMYVKTSSSEAPKVILKEITEGNNSKLVKYQQKYIHYLQNGIPKYWKEVVELYEKILK